MADIQTFQNTTMPNFQRVFSWGLKLSDFNEVFFVTGHTDCDENFVTQYPNDAVLQTKVILQKMKSFIESSGYSLKDVVRTDWTFVDSVSAEEFSQIAALWETYFETLEHKPATGTLRYVSRLGMPELKVEYEMLLAR